MYALNSAPSKLQPRPIATPAPMFGVVLSNPVWVGVGVGALHTSAGILPIAPSLFLTKAPIYVDRRSHVLEFTHCIFYKIYKPNVLQVVMEVMFDCICMRMFSAKMEGCYEVGTV